MMRPGRRVALVTPSWEGDLRRCELLCRSVDRHLTGHVEHLILVEPDDVGRFAHLRGPTRRVIDERELLPEWLRRGRQPGGRRFWWAPRLLTTNPRPLRGWHVQQLRRIAIATSDAADAFLYADSDMAFVRAFDVARLWRDDRLRLYRVDAGVHAGLTDGERRHMAWTRHAARLLDLPAPSFPAPDYINNLVSWRGDCVRAMCARIERMTGRHWCAAIASRPQFSECQIYGAHADASAPEAHWHTGLGLAATYWSGDALDEEGLRAFLAAVGDDQVAVGLQSFTNTDPKLAARVLLD